MLSILNLLLLRVVIYDKVERVKFGHYLDNNKKIEFESLHNVGAWIPAWVEYGEEVNMRVWKSDGAVHRPVARIFLSTVGLEDT